jgi:hypothetical protein
VADLATSAWAVYAAGVVCGLVFIDARWPVRIGLALLWPLGPLAFIVTVTILLLASVVAFPRVAAIAIGLVVLLWWLSAG